MNKTLKVVLINKAILSNGVIGPEYTPMTMPVEQIIQDIQLGKPTPKFAYADHISRIVTLEELEKMVTPLNTADREAALIEEKAPEKAPEVIVEPVVVTEPVIVDAPVETPEEEIKDEDLVPEETPEEKEINPADVVVGGQAPGQVTGKKAKYGNK